jgi:hypothetical protein
MVATATKSESIATALIQDGSMWKWHLKIDELGLYRWYLDGKGRTELRGATRKSADNALRRFTKTSFCLEPQFSDRAEPPAR